MPEALTPLARASLANSLFHASKPADVLPHCAPLASPAIHTKANDAASVTIFKLPDLATHNTHLARSPRLRERYCCQYSHCGWVEACFVLHVSMIMKSIVRGTTVQRSCTPAAARAEPRSEFVVGGECSGQTSRTGQHPTSRHVSFVQYSRNK
jgi:hypothetical protein